MIFLIGFMGAGKTAVSKELARISHKKLIDTDKYIEEKQGKKIPEIFDEYGENGFRTIETECLREIADGEDAIISCGGGIILKEENIRIMKNAGTVVYLKTSPQTVYDRVKHSKNRPLLNGHMNVEYIEELMNKRLPFYEVAMDREVTTDGRNIKDISEEIFCFL